MDQNSLRSENKKLKLQVRSLEQQICERTRNYLVQRTHNNKFLRYSSQQTQTQHEIQSVEVQTEQEDFIPDRFESAVKKEQKCLATPSPFDDSPERSYFETSQEQLSRSRLENIVHRKTYDFHINDSVGKEERSRLKQKGLDLLNEQRLFDEDESSMKGSIISRQTEDDEFIKLSIKEKMKMKKKIDKLTRQLEYEIKVNSIAKQGLLLSEEQNYSFRLTLNQLKEELTTANDTISAKHKSLYELEAFVSKLKNESESLREANNDLKRYISSIETFSMPPKDGVDVNLAERCQQFERFFEIMKEKIFRISNCIPMGDCQTQEFLFRPNSMEELVGMLNRIQQFCTQIEGWEQEKFRIINNEKALFIGFINELVANEEPLTREIFLTKLKSDEALSHYATQIDQKMRSLQKQDKSGGKEGVSKCIQPPSNGSQVSNSPAKPLYTIIVANSPKR